MDVHRVKSLNAARLAIIVLLTALMILPMAFRSFGAESSNPYSSILTKDDVETYYEDESLNMRIMRMHQHEYSFAAKQCEDPDTHLKYWTVDDPAALPHNGNANILVFPVAFADCPASEEESVDELRSRFFGAEDTASPECPYESVSAYYSRSSLGQLNITGEIMDWYTMPKDKTYYGFYQRIEDILREVISYYDDQIDYSQYDTDSDGYLDGVYLYFAGEGDGWGEFFSSHVQMFEGVGISANNSEGKNSKYFVMLDAADTKTLIYQTAKLMGVSEYYSYAIDEIDYSEGDDGYSVYNQEVRLPNWYPQQPMYADDMMNNMREDHNVYTKMWLGWIKPRIVTSDEASQILFNHNQLYDNGEPNCLLVPLTTDASSLEDYLLIEYDVKKGNNLNAPTTTSLGDNKDGKVRIFKINERKDNRRTLNRWCRITRLPLVTGADQATGYTYNEPGVGPYSPIASSTFFFDTDGNMQASGVSVKVKSTGEHYARMSIDFEDDVSTEYSYDLGISNTINLRVSSQVDLRLYDKSQVISFDDDGYVVNNPPVCIYDESGNKVKETRFGYTKIDSGNETPLEAMFSAENDLAPGNYCMEVPAGILMDTTGHRNEAKTISFTIKERPESESGSNVSTSKFCSDNIRLSDGRYAFMHWREGIETCTRYLTLVDEEEGVTDIATAYSAGGGGRGILHELDDGNLLFVSSEDVVVMRLDGTIVKSLHVSNAIPVFSEDTFSYNSYEGDVYYKYVYDYDLNRLSRENIEYKNVPYGAVAVDGEDTYMFIGAGKISVYNADHDLISETDSRGYAFSIQCALKEDDGSYLLLCKQNNEQILLNLNSDYELTGYKELHKPYSVSSISRVTNGYILYYSRYDEYSINGLYSDPFYPLNLDPELIEEFPGGLYMGEGFGLLFKGYELCDDDFKPVDSESSDYGNRVISFESGKRYYINFTTGETSNNTIVLPEIPKEPLLTSEEFDIDFTSNKITGTGSKVTEQELIQALNPADGYEVSVIYTGDGEDPQENYLTAKYKIMLRSTEGNEQYLFTLPELLGHDLVKTDRVEPTCIYWGNIEYWTCRDCGTHFSDETCQTQLSDSELDLYSLGHNTSKVEAKAATCSEEGNRECWTCSRCGKYFYDQNGGTEMPDNVRILSKTDHDWGEWITVTQANCQQQGEEKRVCRTNSEHTENRIIEKTSHTREYIPETPATCTEPGLTQGIVCTVCKLNIQEQSVIPAKGHIYSVVEDSAVEATCENSGKEADQECLRCHDKIEGATTEMLGHIWGDWIIDTDATEEEEGLEVRACERDPAHTEERVIPKKDHVHELQLVESTEPTCTDEGNIEYWSCVKCGRLYVDEECTEGINLEDTVIEPVKHRWDEGAITTEPTCTENGVRTFICLNNPEHTYTEVADKLGHDLAKVDYTASTYAEEGNIEYWKCIRCSHLFSDEAGINEITEDDTVIPRLEKTDEQKDADIASEEASSAYDTAMGQEEDAGSAASNAEASAQSDDPDETLIQVAEAVAGAAVQAAQEAIQKAEKALESARAAYPDGSAEIIAAETKLSNARTLYASISVSKAKTLSASAQAAAKAAAKASAAAEEAATTPGDTAVEAAQQALDKADRAETKANEALSAANGAFAAATASGDESLVTEAEQAVQTASEALAAAEQAAANARVALSEAEQATAEAEEKERLEREEAEKKVKEEAGKKAQEQAAAKQKAEAEQALIAANNGILDPALPKIKLNRPKAAKKSMTSKWKKLSKKQQKAVKGIEIEYSLTKDFQNPIFKNVGKKKASLKIKKLQARKTYYVRAHTYVYRNGQKYVSNWSAVKKVKAK